MLSLLKDNIRDLDDIDITVEGFSADNLNFADNSFDCAVSTLVLCSVDSPAAVLTEIVRVLKPAGRLFFMEHVLAKERPQLVKWQKLFQPLKSAQHNSHLLPKNLRRALGVIYPLSAPLMKH